MRKEWTAPDILQLAGGYWPSCALMAGVQLGLFTSLAAGPRPEAALAGELGCDSRGLGMLATALVALGFLRRTEAGLAATPESLRYLSADSPDYLGFLILHHARIISGWSRLAEAVRSGAATMENATLFTPDEKEREAFLMGMFNVAQHQAARIARSLDLSGRSRLLDVGGGPGTYAVYFCRENPDLHATVFDLPTTEPYARAVIDRFGLGGRVSFAGGNYLSDPLLPDQDVVWLSQVLHGENPDNARKLVARAAACLRPGGLVCVQEFALDDDRNGPVHPALFALSMLVETDAGGQAYTRSEISAMLRDAGASDIRELAIDLPNNCRIILGTVSQ